MMPKSGWRVLPGVMQSSGVYLKRLNRPKSLLPAIVWLALLSSLLCAALIYSVLGG